MLPTCRRLAAAGGADLAPESGVVEGMRAATRRGEVEEMDPPEDPPDMDRDVPRACDEPYGDMAALAEGPKSRLSF